MSRAPYAHPGLVKYIDWNILWRLGLDPRQFINAQVPGVKGNKLIWNAFAVLLCGKCIIWGGDFNISCGKINIFCGYFNM